MLRLACALDIGCRVASSCLSVCLGRGPNSSSCPELTEAPSNLRFGLGGLLFLG